MITVKIEEDDFSNGFWLCVSRDNVSRSSVYIDDYEMMLTITEALLRELPERLRQYIYEKVYN